MRARGYLAFAIGIVLTLLTCLFVHDIQQRQVRDVFQRDVDRVARDTAVRLQTYFDMLLALKGMYALDDGIGRARFHRFVGELDLARRYPGFQAIQFVRLVPQEALGAFADAVRRDTAFSPEGFPAFRVHPASTLAQHFIIEYTEPLKGNENAFGLDLGALAPHLRALELGRDSGEIVATEPIVLVQDASGTPGFVARAPVYRNGAPTATAQQRRAALVGFVAIVFRVNTLMREVVDPALLAQLHVRVDDAGFLADGKAQASGQRKPMFDSAAGAGPLALVSGLSGGASVPVAQRRWELSFEARAGSRYSRSPAPLLLIGVAGLVISALVAALMVASRRMLVARHGLAFSLSELEAEKRKVEQARSDLSTVLQTLKQAQNDLITSEKMAALGALVAGVAHELNTPIGNSLLTATALKDMVSNFEQRLRAEGGLRRSTLEGLMREANTACNIMTGSLERAADLINSFKQVAVDQSSGKRRRFMLDSVLHDTLATYAAQLRRQACKVELNVPDGLEFDSYPGSLSQVLSNLIANTLLHGFDGRESGVIGIDARQLDGERVELRFRDDGVGMSEDTLHKVFDPFFTTKLGQGGSGLGMNIVYNIVTGVLKGTIQVESTPGQGTAITLVLPMRLREQAAE